MTPARPPWQLAWRRCGAPHRPSRVFWPHGGWEAWNQLCFQTAQTGIKSNLWASIYKSVSNPWECLCHHLARSDFDVEVIPLVRNLEYFRPSKPVDPQPVSVDEQAACTNSQHNLYSFRVLETTYTKNKSLSGQGLMHKLVKQIKNNYDIYIYVTNKLFGISG